MIYPEYERIINSMRKYTLCFIRQKDRILLLNREKPMWMGSWNGIGGKFEKGETPTSCALREAYEETGIELEDVIFKGTIHRIIDKTLTGVMYIFLADIPDSYAYATPIKTCEGILDWKLISWILDPDNTGVVKNISMILPLMLETDQIYDHRCEYNINNILVEYKTTVITNQIE